MKDYLEVKGYADAANWVYSQARGHGSRPSDALLTLAEVRHAHRLAMGPVWEVSPHPDAFASERPGNWRRHDIRPFARGMTPPDHTQIPALMHDWVVEAERLPGEPDRIAEAAGRHHAAFERIHPFIDGNGRAGRLLLNLLLIRLGYPPVIIQKRERARYVDALHRADQGDPGMVGELIARSLLDSLNRFVLPAAAGPSALMPLEALNDMGLSVIALRSAAQRFRLRTARAPDGAWCSSRQWVEEYKQNRYSALRQPCASRQSHHACE